MDQTVVTGQPAGPLEPGKVAMMPTPQPIVGCPPGLEYLAQLDQVLINQEVHLLEVLTGFECKNKFAILNNMGQQVYFAGEESSLFQRLCCDSERGFVFHITDNLNQEVLRVRRDFRCCTGCWCCPCETCRYFASVEDRNGQLLGYVSNLFFCCKPRFALFDANRSIVSEIRGPCCPCQTVCCTADVDFPIVDMTNGSEMGTLSKVWPGALVNICTKADNFRVSFPINLDVKKKALMIASVFIIDMMIYEQNDNN